MYKNVHRALFIIAKNWKEPKCPSVGEWINKPGNVLIMPYSSGNKDSDLLTAAPPRMKPKLDSGGEKVLSIPFT